MKIALCFYGLVGSKVGKDGKGENLDPAIAYEHYKKHLIDVNDDVDVFIHSWSTDAKEKLIELYDPKKESIEEQVDFPYAKNHPNKTNIYGMKSKLKFFLLKLFDAEKYSDWIKKKDKECFRAYSRWYSSKKALELKKEYEKENNFNYDAVIIARLDCGFFTDLDFNKYDLDYFYASHRNNAATKEHNYKADYKNYNKNFEFLDFWFFSNSENMDKFAKLYDEIESYEVSPHRSSYQHVEKYIGKEKIKYTLFRWFDHEMIRRKFFEAQE